MTEEEKIASLTEAQQQTLKLIERQLGIYRAQSWLDAKPTRAPVEEPNVWGREIEDKNVTLALIATRASLDANTILIRAVSKPGRPFVMKDLVCGLPALYQTLTDLLGYPPMTASTTRPTRPLRRSRPRRH